MSAMFLARAPAKINLCLFVGPVRGDGRHELVTVMESIALCDEVTLNVETDRAGADTVVCPGVTGPNLAAAALAAFRERTGWRGPPVRLEIVKRIPVAAGMAGGSADAAAALRLAAAAAGIDDDELLVAIATGLGADVPSQVRGGPVLATGAGETLRTLPRGEERHVLVLPAASALSTADVYREADRLGLTRDAAGLAGALSRVEAALARGGVIVAKLIENDLQDAARSLHPPVGPALCELRAHGAEHAIVAGSGPTVIGLFADAEAARVAARALAARRPAPVLSVTVPPDIGRVEATA